MTPPLFGTSLRYWLGAARAAALVAASAALLSACTTPNTNPVTTPVDTPVLVRVEEPQGTSWSTVALTPNQVTPTVPVMPTRGNAVRVVFTGPLGSFEASVQPNGGPVTILPRGRTAGLARPDGAHYEVTNVDPNTSPPTHTMYVRLPTDQPDPLNFSLRVVQKSLNTNRPDSTPLIIQMARRPSFQVTIEVVGDGRVTSAPAGIACGRTQSGLPMTACTFDFPGPGFVQLFPGSGPNGRFRAWGGDCNPTTQVCSLNLSGNAARVIANFDQNANPSTANTCGPTPLVTGWRWIDLPSCATGNIAGHPGITLACNSSGFFCCEPGAPNSPGTPNCGPAK